MDDPLRAAERLIDHIRNSSENDSIMRWQGSKIPRGARIGGVTVGWAQHGRIIGEGGEELGFYKRMQEFAGANHDEHAMLITTMEPVEAIAPDGTVCSQSPGE